MKVAFIVPTAELPYYNTDYHLILPHIESPDYWAYYEQASGHKILDNGVAEGVDFPTWRLLDIAEAVGADEVVVPDVMGNAGRTIEAAAEFGKLASDFGHAVGFMGVIQGATMHAMVSCMYTFAERFPWITTIALPRIMNKRSKWARVQFLESHIDFLTDRFEAIHCLGASSFQKEPLLLSEFPVRGMDTSFPMVMSLAGRRIGKDPFLSRSDLEHGSIGHGRTYFDMSVHPALTAIAHDNHYRYLDWCNAVE